MKRAKRNKISEIDYVLLVLHVIEALEHTNFP